ncbi:MAG TPA: ethanolamine ammonia-lyase light chain EutC, partial [Candidatus Binataceae bacterium]|nr:ethanolamine ammonia-lyase light chain EutC [Candidatus Binataceae bacterium]
MSADRDDQASNPARLDIGRAGTRYKTSSLLNFRADHARAVDAVMTEVSAEWPRRNGLPEFHSTATTREEYLRHPERGRRLHSDEIAKLKRLNPTTSRKSPEKPSLLFFIGDGLSSAAVEANAAPLLRALIRAMSGE